VDRDLVWKSARTDLMMVMPGGEPDPILWEHVFCVTKSCLRICKIPAVRHHNPDTLALTAAGLYHDSHWIERWKAGDLDRFDVRITSATEAQCEVSARFMDRCLGEILSKETMERATQAVRTRHLKEPFGIEAQVLADAENLSEFGLVAAWNSLRRNVIEGKGVEAFIDSWRRKKEYHFWDARLDESFRFEPVRRLAIDRLEKLEQFVEQLERELGGDDLHFPD